MYGHNVGAAQEGLIQTVRLEYDGMITWRIGVVADAASTLCAINTDEAIAGVSSAIKSDPELYEGLKAHIKNDLHGYGHHPEGSTGAEGAYREHLLNMRVILRGITDSPDDD